MLRHGGATHRPWAWRSRRRCSSPRSLPPRAGATAACGRPSPGTATTEVFVVSHGYHAGIVVPLAALADAASRRGLSALGYVATRFADFDRLEIGWGDEGFYREVPTRRIADGGAGHSRVVSAGQPFGAARGRRRGRSARRVRQRPTSSASSSARRASRAWRTSSTPRFARDDGRAAAGGARARALRNEPVLSRQRHVPSASTSAITGSPGCSMPPAFRPRPCSRPCRAACCSISSGAPVFARLPPAAPKP